MIDVIVKILLEKSQDGPLTIPAMFEILYPHVEDESDAVGVHPSVHELTRIESPIMAPLQQLGLIDEERNHLHLTARGQKCLKLYRGSHPIWWNDIGGITNTAILLYLMNTGALDTEKMKDIITVKNQKDFDIIVEELTNRRIGVKIVKENFVLEKDVIFDVETDVPHEYQKSVFDEFNDLTKELEILETSPAEQQRIKDLLEQDQQNKRRIAELEQQLQKRLEPDRGAIDQYEQYLRTKNPHLMTLGIPQDIWDIDLVAKRDAAVEDYYKNIKKMKTWDAFEKKTWQAFKFLGMQVIALGHAKRFQSLPDSGVLFFTHKAEVGTVAYLFLIDNKCTKYVFDVDRFNEYKEKLFDYVYDADNALKSLYANCSPAFFIIIAPQFDAQIYKETQVFTKKELKGIDIKIVLLTAGGLMQLVLEHANKKHAIQKHSIIFKILRHDGIIDENLITQEYNNIK